MFGGPSVEHDVSIITALQVIKNADIALYNIIPLYWTKEGPIVRLRNNKAFTDVASLIACNSWSPVQFTNYSSGHGFNEGWIFKRFQAVDVVIPCFHGTGGEDGAIQGILESFSIPYAGSGVTASALGMDKWFFKAAMRQAGLPVLDAELVAKQNRNDYKKPKFAYPIIVKPVHLGSSIGVTKCDDFEAVQNAFEVIFELDTQALIEPYLSERQEVNCSVLGTSESSEVSVCEEPISSEEILSFEDKYLKGGKGKKGEIKDAAQRALPGGMASLDRRIPAPIEKNYELRITNYAKEVFRSCGCSGVARVDFMIDKKTGDTYITEINTIPGSLSFYLWEASGISFPELIDKLVEIAEFEYKKKKSLLRTFESTILSKQGI